MLKDHNAVTPVRLEPAALRSRVKHSTTEPLRSHLQRISARQQLLLAWKELKNFTCQKGIFSFCHDEFIHSDQPIKTAHEFHVVENDHEPSTILGGPEVKLQL